MYILAHGTQSQNQAKNESQKVLIITLSYMKLHVFFEDIYVHLQKMMSFKHFL